MRHLFQRAFFKKLTQWEAELANVAPASMIPPLSDQGVSLNKRHGEKKYFIKFLGTAQKRVGNDFSVLDELRRSHCHYAICFSRSKGRPRRYNDGDIVYIARMLHGGKYAIIGRCEALRHVDARDVASAEELKISGWKKSWPLYIRVRNTVFIDTIMANCPDMKTLVHTLDYESFYHTLIRHENGEPDINPFHSLRQQADVELSAVGADWLEQAFDNCLEQYGAVKPAFIRSLHPGIHV